MRQLNEYLLDDIDSINIDDYGNILGTKDNYVYMTYDNFNFLSDRLEYPELFITTDRKGMLQLKKQLSRIKTYQNPDYEPWGTPEFDTVSQTINNILKDRGDLYTLTITYWSDEEKWTPRIYYSGYVTHRNNDISYYNNFQYFNELDVKGLIESYKDMTYKYR